MSSDQKPEKNARLSVKDLSMLNVVIAVTRNLPGELRFEIGRALENGVSREEIRGIIDEVAIRTGHRAIDSIHVVEQVLSRFEQ
jgi:alkylhydroperoxidase/carboxymuconolactone decarboxylase family protein YurZ